MSSSWWCTLKNLSAVSAVAIVLFVLPSQSMAQKNRLAEPKTVTAKDDGTLDSPVTVVFGKVDVPGTTRRDEVGDMARAVEIFKENAVENARLAEEQAHEQEQKELRTEKVNGLISEFDASVKSVLKNVEVSCEHLKGDGSGSDESVTAHTSNASSNVQAVASATEELSSSVSEISRQIS